MPETPVHIPVLTTSRLTLRAPRLSDFIAYADFWASDHSKTVGGPLAPNEAWRNFAAVLGHWHLKGFGLFCVDDATGPQGMIGVYAPPHHDDPELAWTLFAPATGKGYATEAAKAVRDWARVTLRPTRLVSYIDFDNIRSQRVAARLGATLEDTRAKHDPRCQIWAHAV